MHKYKKMNRIIPTLLLDDQKFVKTKMFDNPNYLGDPINIMRIFNDKFVDEVCILNITQNSKKINFDYLQKLFSECFLPISYGGLINNIQDVRNIFKIGADKIIFSTNLFKNKNLVIESINEIGSQGVVGCINLIEKDNKYLIYLPLTNEFLEIKSIEDYLLELINIGLGEVIINFVNRDGMRTGYDCSFIKKISNIIKIPLIVLGGANTKKDFHQAFQAGANAVAASSYFVYLGKRDGVMISYSK